MAYAIECGNTCLTNEVIGSEKTYSPTIGNLQAVRCPRNSAKLAEVSP